jgi:hypothetical protein
MQMGFNSAFKGLRVLVSEATKVRRMIHLAEQAEVLVSSPL